MKQAKLTAITIYLMAIVACTNGGGADNSGNGAGAPTASEKAFDGRLQKFNVEFMSAITGKLRSRPYLGYKIELYSNGSSSGDFNIYDCHNSTCSNKFILYKMSCIFSVLFCELTDSHGAPVKKGVEYQVDASDVAEFYPLDNCHQVSGGTYQNCYYLTIIDPKLRQEGFYDQFFATEFVPLKGAKTALNIFRLQHRP